MRTTIFIRTITDISRRAGIITRASMDTDMAMDTAMVMDTGMVMLMDMDMRTAMDLVTATVIGMATGTDTATVHIIRVMRGTAGGVTRIQALGLMPEVRDKAMAATTPIMATVTIRIRATVTGPARVSVRRTHGMASDPWPGFPNETTLVFGHRSAVPVEASVRHADRFIAQDSARRRAVPNEGRWLLNNGEVAGMMALDVVTMAAGEPLAFEVGGDRNLDRPVAVPTVPGNPMKVGHAATNPVDGPQPDPKTGEQGNRGR